jgi:predicted phosphodiesterase
MLGRTTLAAFGIGMAGVLAALAGQPASTSAPAAAPLWAFAVVTDPEPHTAPAQKDALAPFADDLRYLKETFFDKATPQRPRPELIIVPGDVAPLEVTEKAFRSVLGDVPWMPVPGNHDTDARESAKLSELLAARKDLALCWGPQGPKGLQYSFTHHNVLFVGLNIYWNGKLTPGSEIAAASLCPQGQAWVQKTLAQSDARYKIVYGHRPAFPMGNRHPLETLAETFEHRDSFWRMLNANGCQLYLCGHTHAYDTYQWLGSKDPNRWLHYTSTMPASGVWQINAGSVRGDGSRYDRTVLYFRVSDTAISVETHIWPKDSKTPGYRRPANTAQTLYQFEIYPDIARNLRAPAATGAAATMAAGGNNTNR